uniref:Uncharacterized protein n=1 Tax=Arundo donax TaxID=35708 RepID=A0A0A9HGM0_ARUDO
MSLTKNTTYDTSVARFLVQSGPSSGLLWNARISQKSYRNFTRISSIS